jgi:hypothetical protein
MDALAFSFHQRIREFAARLDERSARRQRSGGWVRPSVCGMQMQRRSRNGPMLPVGCAGVPERYRQLRVGNATLELLLDIGPGGEQPRSTASTRCSRDCIVNRQEMKTRGTSWNPQFTPFKTRTQPHATTEDARNIMESEAYARPHTHTLTLTLTHGTASSAERVVLLVVVGGVASIATGLSPQTATLDATWTTTSER